MKKARIINILALLDASVYRSKGYKLIIVSFYGAQKVRKISNQNFLCFDKGWLSIGFLHFGHLAKISSCCSTSLFSQWILLKPHKQVNCIGLGRIILFLLLAN
ncbi:hypothetical protein [Helicobacter aurati]|uniref:hypothetical protein n=1 Tax=Helicobacter aurati TaxID=137778 RepID=UPI0011C03A04|nr:hypothetical protein [Helicobacter aurati]